MTSFSGRPVRASSHHSSTSVPVWASVKVSVLRRCTTATSVPPTVRVPRSSTSTEPASPVTPVIVSDAPVHEPVRVSPTAGSGQR